MRPHAAAAALLLLAFATRADDKPDTIPEPIDGFKGVAMMLPRSMWPDKDKGWTEVQKRAANDWAKKNLLNQQIRITGKAREISPSDRGGVSTSILDFHFPTPVRQIMASCDVYFPKANASPLERASKGDTITFVGTIRGVSFEGDDGEGAGQHTFHIGLAITSGKIEPNPPPAKKRP